MLDATVMEPGELVADEAQFAAPADEMETPADLLRSEVYDAMSDTLGSYFPPRKVIAVDIVGPYVRLSGSVKSYHHKQLAQHGAMAAVPDGFQLLNALVVH